MANQNTVWVVIASDEIIDKLRSLIDKGYLGEAQSLHSQLLSVVDKLNKFLAQRGGSVRLSTYDRIVLEISSSVAEELPEILESYKDFFGKLFGVGIGLDLQEASTAAAKSTRTNQIELFDPADDTFKSEDILELPPNLFDRTDPEPPEPEHKPERKPKDKPVLSDPQTFMQAQSMMLQAIMQQLSPQPPQQMQAQQQQQQEQEQQQPRDLLEMLNGQKVSGHEPQQHEKQSQEQLKEKESSEQDVSDKNHEKVANLLAMVQDKMPKLMELSDKNPEAFKKIVNLIHKIVDVAKTKKTQKSELNDLTDELNKSIRRIWPVGTVIKRRKKVYKDPTKTTTKWRSMASGQVLDSKGEAVSVKSSNREASKGTEE